MIPTDCSKLMMHGRRLRNQRCFNPSQGVLHLSLARSLVVQTCGRWASWGPMFVQWHTLRSSIEVWWTHCSFISIKDYLVLSLLVSCMANDGFVLLGQPRDQLVGDTGLEHWALSFWVSSCCFGINWALCSFDHFIFPDEMQRAT